MLIIYLKNINDMGTCALYNNIKKAESTQNVILYGKITFIFKVYTSVYIFV